MSSLHMIIPLISILLNTLATAQESVTPEISVTSTASIVFIGTVANFATNLDSNTINNARGNQSGNTYLFGTNAATNGIPLCLSNNNILNGVKLKVDQTGLVTDQPELSLKFTANSTNYFLPVTLVLHSNGGATNSNNFKPEGETSQSSIVEITGSTSGETGPTVNSTGAVKLTTSTSSTTCTATAHLDHYDNTSASQSYSNGSTHQGCGVAPVYIDIVAKNSDIGSLPAGTYSMSLTFTSIACNDTTSTSADSCTS